MTGADLRDTYLIVTNFGDAVVDDASFDGAVWDQAAPGSPFRPT